MLCTVYMYVCVGGGGLKGNVVNIFPLLFEGGTVEYRSGYGCFEGEGKEIKNNN